MQVFPGGTLKLVESNKYQGNWPVVGNVMNPADRKTSSGFCARRAKDEVTLEQTSFFGLWSAEIFSAGTEFFTAFGDKLELYVYKGSDQAESWDQDLRQLVKDTMEKLDVADIGEE